MSVTARKVDIKTKMKSSAVFAVKPMRVPKDRGFWCERVFLISLGVGI